MKVISVLGYKRPEYLRQCLEAISEARGVEDYRVHVSIDGMESVEQQACEKVAVDFLWGGSPRLAGNIVLQNCYLGIDQHNITAYTDIFDDPEVDFIVALEDDCLMSPDALEIADWYRGVGKCEEHLLMSLGRVSNDPRDALVPHAFRESAIIDNAWGFCFSRSAWQKFNSVWNSKKQAPTGWDWSLSYEMWAHGWTSLVPTLSRTKNIGRLDGTRSYPEWFDSHMHNQVASSGERIRGPLVIERLTIEACAMPEWARAEFVQREVVQKQIML